MASCCSVGEEDLDFQKRAYRDAALCIGWFKMMSVTFYISLYFLTKFYSLGGFSKTLMLMTLIGILPSVFLGAMLFCGALLEASGGILASLIMCYLLATYDLIVGMTGTVYHIVKADNIQDYVLTLAFILLALTSIPAYCHDAFIINSYRQILDEEKNDMEDENEKP